MRRWSHVERVVRLVFEAKDQYPSQWSAIGSIAGKIGCTAETLRRRVRQAERDQGLREGSTTTAQPRVKELEREVRDRGGMERPASRGAPGSQGEWRQAI